MNNIFLWIEYDQYRQHRQHRQHNNNNNNTQPIDLLPDFLHKKCFGTSAFVKYKHMRLQKIIANDNSVNWYAKKNN